MSKDIFNDNIKYECIQFWKEFIMWILILVILTIIFSLIALMIYCIVTFA